MRYLRSRSISVLVLPTPAVRMMKPTSFGGLSAVEDLPQAAALVFVFDLRLTPILPMPGIITRMRPGMER